MDSTVSEQDNLPGGMTREQLAAIALDPLVQAAAMQDRETMPDRGKHDPQAPFRTEWRSSGPFAGFLALYGIGGISGHEYLDYLLSRDEATQLYAALGAALGITPQPSPDAAVREAAVRALTSAVMHHWPTAGKVFASDASISCLCGVSFFGFNPIGQWLVHVFGAEEYLLDAGEREVRE